MDYARKTIIKWSVFVVYLTCKTYLQTFHVILMRFTNHKITNHKITKGFCDNHQKILYNLLIYYIYYNIYNIFLFIIIILLLPFLFFLFYSSILFFHFIFPFVICDFVILWQCTMKAHRVRSAVRTIGKAHGSRVLCVFGMTAAMTQVLSCANLGSSMWGNSIIAYSDLP